MQRDRNGTKGMRNKYLMIPAKVAFDFIHLAVAGSLTTPTQNLLCGVTPRMPSPLAEALLVGGRDAR
jgi:hypothetical protein